ncbi:Mdm33 family-domain-containing protein [Talaromyces proteolyticus]|uniref:Sensitive to high expression protein 9, mitochondrial n=1 Tax=Talaromyces proteolyticus TaxID=1131652 RepID=A0AAD4Q6A2_9EURO|nr:Mdm33 family-domain-containing protein [Talaromyces proteolyticus]KAH8705433.1 Mdm33 family-domain-containing protein [Talaromyces proteolyticus]
MHSAPLLIRQSLRASPALVRPSPRRLRFALPPPPSPNQPSHSPARSFSICLRCQFRSQSRLYATKEDGKPELVEGKLREEGTASSSDIDMNSPSSVVGAANKEHSPRPVLEKSSTSSTDSINYEEESLPSETEGRRSQLSKKFTDLMDNLQSNVFTAGQRLNDLTGYSAIEQLKQQIALQESQVVQARSLIRQAKEAYSAAINRRSASQREVNELLQRKHAWSPTDLERFTSLYRSDHANEVAEAEAQEALAKAEREVEEVSANLNRSILSRYHEEQIWSDKIRRMSTWGTWGLMGVNVLLFLIFQILVEPWRRRRLVKGFEEKVKEAIETEAVQNRAIVSALSLTPGTATAAETTVVEASLAASSPQDSDSGSNTVPLPHEETSHLGLVSDPIDASPTILYPEPIPDNKTFSEKLATVLSLGYWRQVTEFRLSDHSANLTQRELTAVAVQSAAVGAAVVGVLLAILRLH